MEPHKTHDDHAEMLQNQTQQRDCRKYKADLASGKVRAITEGGRCGWRAGPISQSGRQSVCEARHV